MFEYGFHKGLNGGFPQCPGRDWTVAMMREYDAGYALGWEIRDALAAL